MAFIVIRVFERRRFLNRVEWKTVDGNQMGFLCSSEIAMRHMTQSPTPFWTPIIKSRIWPRFGGCFLTPTFLFPVIFEVEHWFFSILSLPKDSSVNWFHTFLQTGTTWRAALKSDLLSVVIKNKQKWRKKSSVYKHCFKLIWSIKKLKKVDSMWLFVFGLSSAFFMPTLNRTRM